MKIVTKPKTPEIVHPCDIFPGNAFYLSKDSAKDPAILIKMPAGTSLSQRFYGCRLKTGTVFEMCKDTGVILLPDVVLEVLV